jgi:hypothetical protein
MLWLMKFLDLVFGIFFSPLVILTEMKIKDVVEFGRFMKILKHQWKWLKGSLFQCLHHIFT